MQWKQLQELKLDFGAKIHLSSHDKFQHVLSLHVMGFAEEDTWIMWEAYKREEKQKIR